MEECVACGGQGKFCGDCGELPDVCDCSKLSFRTWIDCDYCDGRGSLDPDNEGSEDDEQDFHHRG